MGFSVDDILAEYGTRRSTERSAVPVQPPTLGGAEGQGTEA